MSTATQQAAVLGIETQQQFSSYLLFVARSNFPCLQLLLLFQFVVTLPLQSDSIFLSLRFSSQSPTLPPIQSLLYPMSKLWMGIGDPRVFHQSSPRTVPH
uniref:Uncharacterized protein n=1 Tax=Cacopsylla melanoneura TaxID=428564 RepID=A0A8D8ZQS8_9HEMI